VNIVFIHGVKEQHQKGQSDFRMIKVKARGNESIDQMLKRFKKMCEKEGLTKDIKRNSYYEKPSERRRRRQRKSVKRAFYGP
jgi:small subunit ribosomal protein S21